ncbi:hypothetical protein [Carboxylicivirga sp. RSCT41]|uniref:hypothetical protein n=1 Tax=Carboxylicivirga agarovorans TaxID=3417570 RepID=UPI003D3426CD
MAYGLKLYYEWTSFTGIHNRVEIRDKDKADDTGAVQCIALDNCLEIEYPKKKLCYEPIRSCGATLFFEYKGAEGFLNDFFTPDLQRFKVIHYQESNVNFLGYLNTEMYSENFETNTENGVEVSLTANNGLSILDRMNYIQSDGEFYYGVDNFKTLLQRIIEATGLEYKSLYIKNLSDITIDGVVKSNFLEELHINNSNWIDEDFETASMRDVLENMLLGTGLQLFTIEDDIYILPINLQATASSTNSFYHYTLPSMTKQTNVSIDLSTLEIDDIGFYKGGQSVSYQTAINSQEIEFDPYSIDDDVINGEIGEDDLFITNTGSESFGSGDYAWTKEYYSEHSNFSTNPNQTTYPAKFVKAFKTNEPTKNKNYIDIKSYAMTPLGSYNWAVESKPVPIYVINGSKLLINIEMYLECKDDWENPDDTSGTNLNFGFYEYGCEIYIRSGNYAYNKNTKKFDTYFDSSLNLGYPGTSNRECLIQAHDATATDYTPYNGFDETFTTHNIIEFDYDSGIDVDNNIVVGITPRRNGYLDFVDYARIYDIKVSIYDDVATKYGVDLSELVSSSNEILDNRFKNKGKKIELNCGTILKEPDFKVNNPNQRGAFLWSDDGVNFTPIEKFVKDGLSSESEYFVLQQVIKNYETPSTILKGHFNNFNILKPITYNNYLPNVIMIPTGGVYDYYNDTFSCTLQEIKTM